MNRRIKKKINKRLKTACLLGHYEGYDWVCCGKSYKEIRELIRERRRDRLVRRYVLIGVDMNESSDKEEN